MKVKIDFLFLGILIALSINTIIHCELNNYQLTINNYLGFSSLLLTLGLRILNVRIGRYCLAILLLLSMLNLVCFGVGKTTATISFLPIGFDPLMFLVLSAYYLVNRVSVNRVLSNAYYGDRETQQKEQEVKVKFYLNKFAGLDAEAFENAIKNFKEYPIEAQIALKQMADSKLSGEPINPLQ